MLPHRIGIDIGSKRLKDQAIKTLNDILEGCLERSRSSQHELYKLYYSYAMSVAIRYVLNEPEAVSIVNDSFLKVFRNIEKFERGSDIKPWLRRIVVNTALDFLKTQKKIKMEVDIDDQYDLSATEEILSKIAYQDLLAMISKLSQAYRTVFNLYVIDGYKHDEIAGQLGISAGTSKSNLSKARKALQKMIVSQLGLQHG